MVVDIQKHIMCLLMEEQTTTYEAVLLNETKNLKLIKSLDQPPINRKLVTECFFFKDYLFI